MKTLHLIVAFATFPVVLVVTIFVSLIAWLVEIYMYVFVPWYFDDFANCVKKPEYRKHK